MRKIFRVTFVVKGVQTRVFGVATEAQEAATLAALARGFNTDDVSGVVSLGHCDFIEETADA